MGVRFLTCLLFASCIQAISSSDFHRNFSTSHQTVPNPSKSSAAQINQQPVVVAEKLRLELDSKMEEKYKLSYKYSRMQRLKGGSGGANVDHRPTRSDTSALSPWRISSLFVTLALILLCSFHFL